jgi:endonuclease YncB( thermonuclease family)
MRASVLEEREHRRGLVLGLTLAEVLLLLLFLLMLALAVRLQAAYKERDQFAAALDVLRPPVEMASTDRESTKTFTDRVLELDRFRKRVAELAEVNSKLSATLTALKSDPAKLTATSTAIEWASKIDPNDPPAVLKRALAILEAVGTATRPEEVATISKMRAELDKARTPKSASTGKHNWPPIITLSEADGYFFDSGSAQLSDDFRAALTGKVIPKLLQTIKDYDVNVIEVIGHTDEQRIVERPSNLDKTLMAFLQNKPGVERLVPADNAGLGLARAAAVARVLGTDQRLAEFRILPYSAAQLIDLGDKLATGVNAGDVRERRRIEIRVRRSDKEKSREAESWRAETEALQLDQPLIGIASVIDGDTIEIAKARIRFWGIDAIEADQTCTRDGRVWDCARHTLVTLKARLDRQTVYCQPKGRDLYGRIVATCQARGEDIGTWLVGQGLALDYPEFSGGAYAAEQVVAQAAKRGLWRGDFQLPWEWRQARKQ